MENKKVILAQKKSGNYTITSHMDSAWTLIGEFERPIDLLKVVNSLGNKTVIKAEYSQSQLKTIASMYSAKDALKAFGLPATKANITNIENL